MAKLTSAQIEAYVAIWSKAVETQMHFNEMSVKSRQLGLAFVAAALGLAVVLFGRGEDFSWPLTVCNYKVHLHVSVFIILAAILAITAVRILDVNVYHKMLRGAVTFGEDFEKNYMKDIFCLEKGMTTAISHFSRFEDASVDSSQQKYKYLGTKKRTALEKIKTFYNVVTIALVISALAIFLVTVAGK